MPRRNIVPTDQLADAAFQRLREAARSGFADIEEGRYRDVSSDDLKDFIAEIGRRASATLRNIG
ncbi:hypothetical protein FFK22_026205 [Mycobacterium sp. KBS0706]|uniref:hypothetical protein n=1 Tax=Mycobacterium sp. KBS0706 TaxID=2578109 RepID=UPI00110F8CFB|nr:hypothetical protein [Mycobacterium sp. KBS0706]TSD85654.1 hypothetical protein FFK22_026205 [Mycobacterium sp. KBS0706]